MPLFCAISINIQYYKTEHLPRQARDKHSTRETFNTGVKNDPCFYNLQQVTPESLEAMEVLETLPATAIAPCDGTCSGEYLQI